MAQEIGGSVTPGHVFEQSDIAGPSQRFVKLVELDRVPAIRSTCAHFPGIGKPSVHKIAGSQRDGIDLGHLIALDAVMPLLRMVMDKKIDASYVELEQHIIRPHSATALTTVDVSARFVEQQLRVRCVRADPP